jgi:hypothetical protein
MVAGFDDNLASALELDARSLRDIKELCTTGMAAFTDDQQCVLARRAAAVADVIGRRQVPVGSIRKARFFR